MARSKATARTCLITTVLLLTGLRPVEAGEFRTRLEAGGVFDRSEPSSLDAALGFADRQTAFAGLRVMWNEAAGPLQFEIHSNLRLTHGDDPAYRAAVAPFLPKPPPATLLDLTANLHSGGRTEFSNTVDRLSVTYAGPSLVVKIGRQAITWGSGIFFHPSDIVAPFAPNQLDTSYKPGVDMIYAQYLFESGADIQAIAVPRPARDGGPVISDASTFALRGSHTLGELNIGFTAARDRGDTLAGFTLGGALGGAAWNAEIVHHDVSGGARRTS
ncbi:MAG: hypothetical protein ACE5FS_09345 [Paracoccaceae bacterium]